MSLNAGDLDRLEERAELISRHSRDEDEYHPTSLQEGFCADSRENDLPVFDTIHWVRQLILTSIDVPLSEEQFDDTTISTNFVRPLVLKFYEFGNIAIVYCLLVNRLQFSREECGETLNQALNQSRALLCEIVALRVLQWYNDDNPGATGLLKLSSILVGGFQPFQGASEEVTTANKHAMHWIAQKMGGEERKLTALEVAILSGAKSFLTSPACQKVVDAIYRGRITYTPSSFVDIIPDHYKHKRISLYDPSTASLFNQYRLNVPRTRKYLEVGQFVVLLVLYCLVMVSRRQNRSSFGTYELVFCVYTLGWVLDQVASILEHGWFVYTQNLWAFLDVVFASIFLTYGPLRIAGFFSQNHQLSSQAIDVLCLGAPVLFPRLAFNLLSENMLFLSLRAMMADFLVLSLLATWCFAGFLLGLTWLSTKPHLPTTIAKWMVWVWFGLDGTGIGNASDIHPVFGPVLMVSFAMLGNTLFLTILVSMLSHTFSTIMETASSEIQYRRAVLTFGGVKSDAIFAFQPPFNVLALITLLPLKVVLSPRWFHKANVGIVRVLNAPILILICWTERQVLLKREVYHATSSERTREPSRFQKWRAFWSVQRFSVHGDIQTVFNYIPPPPTLEGEQVNDLLIDLSSPQSLKHQEEQSETNRGTSTESSEDAFAHVGNQRAESTDDTPTNRTSRVTPEPTNVDNRVLLASHVVKSTCDLSSRVVAFDGSISRIEALLREISDRRSIG